MYGLTPISKKLPILLNTIAGKNCPVSKRQTPWMQTTKIYIYLPKIFSWIQSQQS